MLPGIYNIQAYRNDTLQRTITLTDGSGNAISLSTADVKLQVRNRPDGTVLLALTEGDGITISGAGNNVITLSKNVSIVDAGCYFYDLQAAFSSGVITTYIRGSFIVYEDITK